MDDLTGIQETSKYNEAGFQIERLHAYWQLCEVYAFKGQFNKWKFTLDAIWRELISDVYRLAKDNETENAVKDNIKLKKAISYAILKKSRTQLYDALSNRHEFLKRIQDKAGKGGIYSDGSEDDFE